MNYTGIYADCYVLASERTLETVNRFLDQFLPEREPAASAYELPQYGEQTEREFDSTDELVKFLAKDTLTPYSIYWRNLETSDLKNAMCFFTDDNCLILGLSCDTLENDSKVEDSLFEQLKNFGGTSTEYITYENPSPTNSEEFKRIVNTKAQQSI